MKKRLRQMAWPMLGLLVLAYFSYHAVQGERGVIAWKRMDIEIAKAEAILDQVRADREGLEHRVSLLRPDGLDPDMLDERVRAMLGYVHPDEVVVLGNAAPSTPQVLSTSTASN